MLDYSRVTTFDPSIDTVGDESDSDDGNNGDVDEVQCFQEVVASGTANSSRASSIGSWSPPTGSWLPPTPISNTFGALSVDEPVRIATVLAAPISWDFRRSSPGRSDTSAESVTDRICREITEAQQILGFRATPTAPIIPPGLEAVPVSCYSGSFKIWSFVNDMIPDLEKSEADDEEFFVEQEKFISEQ